jgi:SAM-dependent methyltransferase
MKIGSSEEFIVVCGTGGSRMSVTSENDELETLIRMALVGKAAGATDLDHMDGAAAAFNYIRIAEFVNSYFRSGRIRPPILDWGCGYGQVSWLLQRRGVDVVSFDIEKRPARDVMSPLSSVSIEYSADLSRLPYASSLFEAVLSVGVLEHVDDIDFSLREVNRVLRPGGLFLIFMFPNRYSWTEWIQDRRHIYVHPNKYTIRQTTGLLNEKGFDVEAKWRRNFLPRNLTGFSPRFKAFYGRYYRQIESLDKVLANWLPTAILSGVLELVARKR